VEKIDRDEVKVVNKPSATRVVRCPGCGGDSIYAPTNPARPFCSERCKNMDFGAWASESFRMPATTEPDGVDGAGITLQ